MACTLCLSQDPSSACQFSLITALDSIKIHYTAMAEALKEKSDELKNMENRNFKLMKTIDCLKKSETIFRMTCKDHDKSISQQPISDRASRANATASPILEDIITIDDDDEDNISMGVTDTALNGSANNNDDVLTETESPKLETVAANPTKSEEIKNDKQINWKSKQKVESSNKQKLKRRPLKQTKLVFEDKRERTSPVEKAQTSQKKLLKSISKSEESKVDSIEDMFNLNSTSTFQFKSASPKKTKLRDFNEDDTSEVKTEQKRNASPGGDGSSDRRVDFEIRKENQESILISSTPEYSKKDLPSVQQEEPVRKIWKERDRKPVNPIFNTDTEEKESDGGDFMVRPIQVKIEPPENIEFIDINTIDCEDCRKYVQFCGNRMTAAKLQEHIRKCVSHNNKQREVLRAKTPEGFWNPLLESFAQSDQRNEVLLDDRFNEKKTFKKWEK